MRNLLSFIFLCLPLLFACSECDIPDFPEVSSPFAVTTGPKDHFLANYFGINSWDNRGRYLAVLETEINGRLVGENEPAVIALVDLHDGNKLIPVAQTCCWNFQEGAMFHWLSWAEDTFIYNDMRAGCFVSVIFNWKTREERIIPYPISAVSADGRTAISINYARLRLARPDYGYAGNGQDPYENVCWPDNDGLWRVDLMTGEAELILSIASQKERMTPIEDPHGLAYFCHTVISKDASKVFWLARTVENLTGQGKVITSWKTTSMTCNIDGSDVRRCYPDGWEGSHFNWLDDNTIAVTAKWDAGGAWSHTIFSVGEEDKVRHIAPGILDWDGHCIFSPDGNFLFTDGYWNRSYNRSWVMVRLADEAIMPIGSFYVPENYREQYSRCDLHPRFRPDGKQIAFNSVHEGSRQVYVRNVKF